MTSNPTSGWIWINWHPVNPSQLDPVPLFSSFVEIFLLHDALPYYDDMECYDDEEDFDDQEWYRDIPTTLASPYYEDIDDHMKDDDDDELHQDGCYLHH